MILLYIDRQGMGKQSELDLGLVLHVFAILSASFGPINALSHCSNFRIITAIFGCQIVWYIPFSLSVYFDQYHDLNDHLKFKLGMYFVTLTPSPIPVCTPF